MNTAYQKARYLTSAPSVKTALRTKVRSRFAGRSNAGKSSAINAITQQSRWRGSARRPVGLGCSFSVDDQSAWSIFRATAMLRYRKRSRRIGARRWRIFQRAPILRGVFLVMDIRHPLTPFDRHMIEWCRHWELPLHIALTKADKLGRGAALQTLRTVEAELKTIEGLKISLQLFRRSSVPDWEKRGRCWTAGWKCPERTRPNDAQRKLRGI